MIGEKPVEPDKIDQVLERMKQAAAGGEPGLALDPDAPTPKAPPKRGRPRKATKEQEEIARQEAEAARTAQFLEGAKEMLYSVWVLGVSLAASAQVKFGTEEAPIVKDALVQVAQQYLPDGWTEHAPLASLLSISLVAALRARSGPTEAEIEAARKENADAQPKKR